ncbi:hypothetical protein BESB_048100 [Besnoitia besnoiti]|uniref:Uncharacterized protein n=1 Tax=Besnoitia besnoiti TaxID=94643 RepID=A0A2A9MDN6_BESBE|nr:hypothetical protein BESB_048100 [Besnoitia besnoiti]PFH36618.1 hypothetical protein BESB_048100 [Besnoitia besnoiti]
MSAHASSGSPLGKICEPARACGAVPQDMSPELQDQLLNKDDCTISVGMNSITSLQVDLLQKEENVLMLRHLLEEEQSECAPGGVCERQRKEYDMQAERFTNSEMQKLASLVEHMLVQVDTKMRTVVDEAIAVISVIARKWRCGDLQAMFEKKSLSHLLLARLSLLECADAVENAVCFHGSVFAENGTADAKVTRGRAQGQRMPGDEGRPPAQPQSEEQRAWVFVSEEKQIHDGQTNNVQCIPTHKETNALAFEECAPMPSLMTKSSSTPPAVPTTAVANAMGVPRRKAQTLLVGKNLLQRGNDLRAARPILRRAKSDSSPATPHQQMPGWRSARSTVCQCVARDMKAVGNGAASFISALRVVEGTLAFTSRHSCSGSATGAETKHAHMPTHSSFNSGSSNGTRAVPAKSHLASLRRKASVVEKKMMNNHKICTVQAATSGPRIACSATGYGQGFARKNSQAPVSIKASNRCRALGVASSKRETATASETPLVLRNKAGNCEPMDIPGQNSATALASRQARGAASISDQGFKTKPAAPEANRESGNASSAPDIGAAYTPRAAGRTACVALATRAVRTAAMLCNGVSLTPSATGNRRALTHSRSSPPEATAGQSEDSIGSCQRHLANPGPQQVSPPTVMPTIQAQLSTRSRQTPGQHGAHSGLSPAAVSCPLPNIGCLAHEESEKAETAALSRGDWPQHDLEDKCSASPKTRTPVAPSISAFGSHPMTPRSERFDSLASATSSFSSRDTFYLSPSGSSTDGIIDDLEPTSPLPRLNMPPSNTFVPPFPNGLSPLHARPCPNSELWATPSLCFVPASSVVSPLAGDPLSPSRGGYHDRARSPSRVVNNPESLQVSLQPPSPIQMRSPGAAYPAAHTVIPTIMKSGPTGARTSRLLKPASLCSVAAANLSKLSVDTRTFDAGKATTNVCRSTNTTRVRSVGPASTSKLSVNTRTVDSGKAMTNVCRSTNTTRLSSSEDTGTAKQPVNTKNINAGNANANLLPASRSSRTGCLAAGGLSTQSIDTLALDASKMNSNTKQPPTRNRLRSVNPARAAKQSVNSINRHAGHAKTNMSQAASPSQRGLLAAAEHSTQPTNLKTLDAGTSSSTTWQTTSRPRLRSVEAASIPKISVNARTLAAGNVTANVFQPANTTRLSSVEPARTSKLFTSTRTPDAGKAKTNGVQPPDPTRLRSFELATTPKKSLNTRTLNAGSANTNVLQPPNTVRLRSGEAASTASLSVDARALNAGKSDSKTLWAATSFQTRSRSAGSGAKQSVRVRLVNTADADVVSSPPASTTWIRPDETVRISAESYSSLVLTNENDVSPSPHATTTQLRSSRPTHVTANQLDAASSRCGTVQSVSESSLSPASTPLAPLSGSRNITPYGSGDTHEVVQPQPQYRHTPLDCSSREHKLSQPNTSTPPASHPLSQATPLPPPVNTRRPLPAAQRVTDELTLPQQQQTTPPHDLVYWEMPPLPLSTTPPPTWCLSSSGGPPTNQGLAHHDSSGTVDSVNHTAPDDAHHTRNSAPGLANNSGLAAPSCRQPVDEVTQPILSTLRDSHLLSHPAPLPPPVNTRRPSPAAQGVTDDLTPPQQQRTTPPHDLVYWEMPPLPLSTTPPPTWCLSSRGGPPTNQGLAHHDSSGTVDSVNHTAPDDAHHTRNSAPGLANNSGLAAPSCRQSVDEVTQPILSTLRDSHLLSHPAPLPPPVNTRRPSPAAQGVTDDLTPPQQQQATPPHDLVYWEMPPLPLSTTPPPTWCLSSRGGLPTNQGLAHHDSSGTVDSVNHTAPDDAHHTRNSAPGLANKSGLAAPSCRQPVDEVTQPILSTLRDSHLLSHPAPLPPPVNTRRPSPAAQGVTDDLTPPQQQQATPPHDLVYWEMPPLPLSTTPPPTWCLSSRGGLPTNQGLAWHDSSGTVDSVCFADHGLHRHVMASGADTASMPGPLSLAVCPTRHESARWPRGELASQREPADWPLFQLPAQSCMSLPQRLINPSPLPSWQPGATQQFQRPPAIPVQSSQHVFVDARVSVRTPEHTMYWSATVADQPMLSRGPQGVEQYIFVHQGSAPA